MLSHLLQVTVDFFSIKYDLSLTNRCDGINIDNALGTMSGYRTASLYVYMAESK